MARKPKGESPLTKPYGFRLPQDEAEDLDARIAAFGGSASEFLRDFVLKSRTIVIAKPKASPEKKRVQFVFNKVGRNLNQIAHVLNAANLTNRLTDQLFRQAVQGLEDIAMYLKAALDHAD
ncbi:plasmid mobilization protein [Massilia sp. LXY-6]|uniref:plasmid mobilization protein n=1 Tax=Massilia sp. LXY-6 TaxID=3379823 RepID=UPI003EDF9C9A